MNIIYFLTTKLLLYMKFLNLCKDQFAYNLHSTQCFCRLQPNTYKLSKSGTSNKFKTLWMVRLFKLKLSWGRSKSRTGTYKSKVRYQQHFALLHLCFCIFQSLSYPMWPLSQLRWSLRSLMWSKVIGIY